MESTAMDTQEEPSEQQSPRTGKESTRMQTGTLGFPHLGSQRQLKFALEAYWSGEIGDEDLLDRAKEVEEEAWTVQRDAGVDYIGVGDFALYDWTMDWMCYLGCIPTRFSGVEAGLPRYFALARGAEGPEGHAIPPLEMRKWFDTNYQYQVPELMDADAMEQPSAHFEPLIDGVRRALRVLGREEAAGLVHQSVAVPMLLGPLTFLWLGYVRPDTAQGRERMGVLLSQLCPLYEDLLAQLAALGIHEVQMHEPALVTQEGVAFLPFLHQTYDRLLKHASALHSDTGGKARGAGLGIDLVTYFGEVHEEVFTALLGLPFAALSLDFSSASAYPLMLEAHGFPKDMRLGLGALDGRSVWKPDPSTVFADIAVLRRAVQHVRLQPSCSLQFLPFSVTQEAALLHSHKALAPTLSFALEKLRDLQDLASAMGDDDTSRELEDVWVRTRLERDTSYEVSNEPTPVKMRVSSLQQQDFERSLSYQDRWPRQMRSKLPLLPTSAVGALPRPPVPHTEGGPEYVRACVEACVRMQEEVGLDVLVPGSAERLDMVETMASALEGMCLTEHGWVRVYGSRCVRPPLIISDVARPRPVTVDAWQYAQSLTSKVVKAEVVGPVTLLNWSFPRADRSHREQCLQLALCVRDEVRDLEIAGARVISVDEPGFREGLPLQGQKRADYLQFCGRAFRLATSIAGPHIELHMHVAHSEVTDAQAIPALLDFDADVYLIENARSQNEVLHAFASHQFPRSLGVGCLDVHCPLVPSADELAHRLREYTRVFPLEQLVVVPDSSLRSRTFPQAKEALSNMVQAAVRVRGELRPASEVDTYGYLLSGSEGPADPPQKSPQKSPPKKSPQKLPPQRSPQQSPRKPHPMMI